MKRLLVLCLFPQLLWASPDPLLAEAKVQSDLEATLSRVMARERFLVLVNSEVSYRPERRLVQGETVFERERPTVQNENGTFNPMPGFVPEVATAKEQPAAPPEHQIYRSIDVPVLKSLRVEVNLDEKTPQATVFRARRLVQDYLHRNYPNIATVAFDTVPMRSTASEKEPEAANAPAATQEEDAEPTPVTPVWMQQFPAYAPWGLAGLAIALLLLSLLRRGSKKEKAPPPRVESPQPNLSQVFFPGQSPATLASIMAGRPSEIEKKAETGATYRRKRLLKKFLAKAEAFRQWYLRLNEHEREALGQLMAGPGFNSLIEQLALPGSGATNPTGSGEDEHYEGFEKSFEEFANTVEWQDQQFFGFLLGLADDQLQTLAKHVSPQHMCFMLKYLRPDQSARLLDAVGPVARAQILAELTTVKKLTLTDIAALEREMRVSVQKLPRLANAASSEVDYWGRVLGHLENQDAVLKAIEKTDPEIYPALKRFRFKLDDVASAPEELVEKVCSETENDELALALVGAPPAACDRMLRALTTKRRMMLEPQIQSQRNMADKNQIRQAVTNVTKRFRDAMAA